MSDNWVVQNLENALNTWNEKLAEIWQLITQSPENFKGGAVLLLHIQAMAEQYTVEIMTYHLICVKEAKVKSMHRKMETGSISLLPLSLTAKKE